MLNQILLAGKIVEEPTIKKADNEEEYYSMKIAIAKGYSCKKENNTIELAIEDENFDKIMENFKKDKVVGLRGEVVARIIDGKTISQVKPDVIEIMDEGKEIKENNDMFNKVVLVGKILSINESIDKNIPSSFTMTHTDKKNNVLSYDCVISDNTAQKMTEYCNIGSIVGINGHIESNEQSGFSIVSERVSFLSEAKKDKETKEDKELENEI